MVRPLTAKLSRRCKRCFGASSAQSTSWMTVLLTNTAAADWPKVFAVRIPAATAQAAQLPNQPRGSRQQRDVEEIRDYVQNFFHPPPLMINQTSSNESTKPVSPDLRWMCVVGQISGRIEHLYAQLVVTVYAGDVIFRRNVRQSAYIFR